MQRNRQIVKIVHTVAAAGLIGGMVAYMLLLVVSPPADLTAYAGLRRSLEVVSNYLILPSMVIALISGLLSMAVHSPFLDKGWVWIKAATGILMFKGVLHVDSASSDYAASLAGKIADGSLPPEALQRLVNAEWYTLGVLVFVAVANVVLGVWRPRRIMPASKPADKVAVPAE